MRLLLAVFCFMNWKDGAGRNKKIVDLGLVFARWLWYTKTQAKNGRCDDKEPQSLPDKGDGAVTVSPVAG